MKIRCVVPDNLGPAGNEVSNLRGCDELELELSGYAA